VLHRTAAGSSLSTFGQGAAQIEHGIVLASRLAPRTGVGTRQSCQTQACQSCGRRFISPLERLLISRQAVAASIGMSFAGKTRPPVGSAQGATRKQTLPMAK